MRHEDQMRCFATKLWFWPKNKIFIGDLIWIVVEFIQKLCGNVSRTITYFLLKVFNSIEIIDILIYDSLLVSLNDIDNKVLVKTNLNSPNSILRKWLWWKREFICELRTFVYRFIDIPSPFTPFAVYMLSFSLIV